MNEHAVVCPYCWQRFEVLIDPDQETAELVVDCEVCCNPIAVAVVVDWAGDVSLSVNRENQ